MMRKTTTLSVALALSLVGEIPAQAADMGAHVTPAPSYGLASGQDRSSDADALSLLAPLSRRSTASQDYGDAAYARARANRRSPSAPGYGEATGAGYDSTPERPSGFRPGFTYGPAYLSAPQIFGGSPLEQTPLLPFLGK